jgi:hypothetical protein
MEWKANCDYRVSRMDTRAANYGHLCKLLSRLKQCKVVRFVGSDYPQGCCTFAHKISTNFAHAVFDDVIVCYDMSRVADDEAGPCDIDHLLLR